MSALSDVIELAYFNVASRKLSDTAQKELDALRDEIEGLKNKVAVLEANPQVGTCCICGSAIWHKEARMTDERGEFHPICAIKAERDALQKLCGEMAEAGGNLVQWSSRIQAMGFAITKYRTLNPVPDSEK